MDVAMQCWDIMPHVAISLKLHCGAWHSIVNQDIPGSGISVFQYFHLFHSVFGLECALIYFSILKHTPNLILQKKYENHAKLT